MGLRTGRMQGASRRSDGLLELALRSFTERKALYALILAAYRVELTSALRRAASHPVEEEDALIVYDLAARIADAAGDARISCIRSEALTLRNSAAEAHGGGRGAGDAMLLAGMRVIERILMSAQTQGLAAGDPDTLN